jgi:hypothetical protein
MVDAAIGFLIDAIDDAGLIISGIQRSEHRGAGSE